MGEMCHDGHPGPRSATVLPAGPGVRGKVCHKAGELCPGLGRGGAVHPLAELLPGQPPGPGGRAEPFQGRLPLGVRRADAGVPIGGDAVLAGLSHRIQLADVTRT